MNEAIGMQAEIIKQIAPDIVKRCIEGFTQWLTVWQVVAVIAAVVAIVAIVAAVVLVYKHNHPKNDDGTVRELSHCDKEALDDHFGLFVLFFIAVFIFAISLFGISSCANGINTWTNSPTESVLRYEFNSFK